MRNLILSIVVLTTLIGCKGSKSSKNDIIVHEFSNPDKLLPYASTAANATALERFLFQKLIDWDYEKNEFIGVLAVDRPKVTPFGSGLKLEFEIRPEAKWDNGTDITAYDVAMSYKAALNPKTNCEHIRPYFDFLSDIVIDTANPKKFTVYSDQKYILAEEYAGYWVLPEYIYDKDKLLRKFKISDFRGESNRNKLKIDKDILKFADEFNSQKFSREKGFVVGSGPYELKEWITDSKITFTKKKNWWGRNSSNEWLKSYGQAETIKFQIINDWKVTSTALKGKELEVVKSIEFKIFNDLIKEEKFTQNFNVFTPKSQQYVYIGINQANPKFKDIKVRQALAHAIDKDQIINTLLFGKGEAVESMVSLDKKYCNKNLKKYEYNLETSKKLLDEAGWKDSDGDGIRDKIIDGKKIKLEIEYKYNSGNDTRKNIGLIYKENLKKIGIDMNISVKEWVKYLDELKAHDFEIYCGAWIGDPNVEDQKQIFHSSSADGSNYVSYGDPVSDKMIDDIRSELNESKRDAIYMKFQEKVHNDIPYIFLYSPLERIAISKRFPKANTYVVRPGYDLGLFKFGQ